MAGASTTAHTVTCHQATAVLLVVLLGLNLSVKYMFLLFPGVKCPSPGSVAKGRVTPNLSEYLFRDYIYVRCDQGYKLMMVS